MRPYESIFFQLLLLYSGRKYRFQYNPGQFIMGSNL